jgi:hypothetical protein
MIAKRSTYYKPAIADAEGCEKIAEGLRKTLNAIAVL